MLISCTSCNSRYLVNSADLQPSGRAVQCVKCGNQWYQNNIWDEDLKTNNIQNESMKGKSNPVDPKELKENIKKETPNLPSTIVREKKVSILNSFLIIFFVFFLISSFLFFRNLDLNNLVLLKFYFNEFTFNLNLISDDIAKIIYKLINFVIAILE